MTVQDLGTFALDVGAVSSVYLPFGFRRRNAYGVRATFTSSDFNSIFSYVRITPLVEIIGEQPVYLSDYTDLEILSIPQLFFFPGSDIYGGSGDVIFHARRMSRYIGGDDAIGVTLNLSIEDSNNTGTWR